MELIYDSSNNQFIRFLFDSFKSKSKTTHILNPGKLFASKYLDKDFTKVNPWFTRIANDPKLLRQYYGRVYCIRFERDVPYLYHEELWKIGPF